MARITYQHEAEVEENDLGLTLLQISHKNNVPHMHACGGNARCSTCRVMVVEHLENVLPRNTVEARLAQKKGLEDNIRLACQTKITGPVTIRRLVLDEDDVDLALAQSATSGREGELAILFSDIRNFTTFAEQNLPYDVIHMLNRYFLQMGDAVLANQGYIDKYIGDGLMALFGLVESDPATVCINAVTAALQMVEGMQELNLYLERHFGVQYRIGIGIHFGEVLIGDLGHPRKMQFTAIGDSVNMASRIESATKEAQVPLLISESVYAHVNDRVQIGKIVATGLKGKTGSYNLYEVAGLNTQSQQSMDLRARAEKELKKIVTAQNAPAFLRLAFHDAATYERATNTGGANGSIRCPEELNRDENRGVSGLIRLLGRVKDGVPESSWADLIALAGALAVARTGGPHILVPLGRADADGPDPAGRIRRLDDMNLDELKARFAEQGMSVQDLVALSGAHTLGKVGGLPFTDDLFSFTNSYFKLLLTTDPKLREHLLPTDLMLAEDTECRQFVETYARDQESFFQDFSSAYTRLTLLGTGLAP